MAVEVLVDAGLVVEEEVMAAEAAAAEADVTMVDVMRLKSVHTCGVLEITYSCFIKCPLPCLLFRVDLFRLVAMSGDGPLKAQGQKGHTRRCLILSCIYHTLSFCLFVSSIVQNLFSYVLSNAHSYQKSVFFFHRRG